MTPTIDRTEVNRRETDDRPGGDVERRAAVFARELGAVGAVGWLLAKRAAVLAGRMEHLAERDEVMVAVNVEAARDEFDRERRAERRAWAAALDGGDPERIAEALANLELSGPGLDTLHRLWDRLLEGVRSDDPATVEGASAQARTYLDAMGMGAPAGAGDLAAPVAAEVARLRGRDDRTRPALEKLMADARREAGLVAAFDPSREATLARRHEAAAERGFFRAIKLIRDLRRDAGLAPAAEAEAEARAPIPDLAPAPPGRPERHASPPAELGSFRLATVPVPLPLPIATAAGPLASFRVGVEPARRGRPDLAKVGGKRR